MWTWFDAEIIQIDDMSPITKRFLIKTPSLESIHFKPGQFITMDLPIHEKRLKRWRSYSIANAPNGSNVMEFSIAYMEGGLASEYFFKEAKVGTQIKYKGPEGVFAMPENDADDIFFICTGTGVAPFRSMLQALMKQNDKRQSIHLIYGTRFKNNILYQEEFEKMAQEWPEFSYHVTLSKEVDWEGAKGHVHDIYERIITNPSYSMVLLCGWQAMVDEAKARLENLGVPADKILYELYG